CNLSHCSLLKSPRFMSVKWLRSPIFQYTTSLKTRPSPPQGGKFRKKEEGRRKKEEEPPPSPPQGGKFRKKE
ncbi:hypothetical protein, partial [Microcoleus sp.]|uniref:hypothetical protein n=2 Tax=Microcoleus sp. TaxID=44472 RepID=UPI0035258829